MTNTQIEEAAEKISYDTHTGGRDTKTYWAFVAGAKWAREEAAKIVENIGRELRESPGVILICCDDIAKEIRGGGNG